MKSCCHMCCCYRSCVHQLWWEKFAHKWLCDHQSTRKLALVCRTDQPGDGAGSWFNPNGTMVEFNSNSSEGFYSSVGSDGVYLLRGSGIPVEGIYTCVAIDSSLTNQTVFIGLYNENRGRSGQHGKMCIQSSFHIHR